MKELVVRTHTITDPDPERIASVLRGHAARGTLVTPPDRIQALTGPIGWTVRVKLREEIRVPARRRLARVHARALRWDTDHPVLAAIAKALTFVGALFGLGALAVVLLLDLLSGIDWGPIGGLLAVAVILFLLIANRSSHSGACPGIVVHCKGRKH